MSFLVLPQHEQFYLKGLSVFVGLDKVSTKIQGLSSTDCNFKRTFKACANPVVCLRISREIKKQRTKIKASQMAYSLCCNH